MIYHIFVKKFNSLDFEKIFQIWIFYFIFNKNTLDESIYPINVKLKT